jgi:hypothetical protein
MGEVLDGIEAAEFDRLVNQFIERKDPNAIASQVSDEAAHEREVLEVLQYKLADFCRRHHIRKVHLFGSALGEDFGPESDVDVLVEFEPDAQIGFIALSRMQRELAELFQRPVDLVPRDGLKPRIREAVLSSAEVIYAT